MPDNAVGRWLNAAGRVPLLTPAEELHLGTLVQAWQQWPGGPDAAPLRSAAVGYAQGNGWSAQICGWS